jgi:hypothetical protein
MVSNLLLQWRKEGRALSGVLASVMSRNLLVFGLSDLGMVAFTIVSVPVAKAVASMFNNLVEIGRFARRSWVLS